MPGLQAPNDFPIRDPKDGNQVHGRTVNPPRYQEMGNLSGPGKWAKGNQMKVEKPTRLSVSHGSSGKNED